MLGTAIALSAGRLVQFAHHGMPMYDPLVHAVSTVVIAGIVTLAAAAPAVRSAVIPPCVALRGDAD